GVERMTSCRQAMAAAAWVLAGATLANAQTWQPLTNQPGFNAGATLLLTDGSVLVHVEQSDSQNWYKLSPDPSGSYANGTWKQVASLPAGYAPLYFSSAVLPDGRVIIEGGEYNCAGGSCNAAWTNQGALYDPLKNAWKPVQPPAGWTTIGDAQSVILANGT